ncbi:hypothetical protein SAMN05444354_11924 [Stigmatella aurantiaca]|uniref:DUF1585 domain-containing protein n=1 Tax=Stigmatella aurantiaca TaxID=41 RepID=A0A1H7ZJF1_STIAU|nr:hypothetical protein SAMN05444354_11924 [Stigmatella aurantiaca]
MPRARRCFTALAALALLMAVAPAASAEEAVCGPVEQVPLQRHLRQLSLDLLGRPPTIEEYQAIEAQGSIGAEDIQQMMNSEEFYLRMRGFHRALLRSNIRSSVNDNGDYRVQGTGAVNNPFGMRGNTATGLRGVNGQACDGYIEQSECNSTQQDPHAEPASKKCADERGVPLPVSYDYDTNYFACTRLDATDASVTSCEVAVTKGLVPAKRLYFCDMRRLSDGKLHPHYCVPDPAKNTTGALTQEELDGSGKVVAFLHPNPPDSRALARLDRCTLEPTLRNGVKGSYAAPRGCIQREGYLMKPLPFFPVSPAAEQAGKVAVCAYDAQERDVNPWTLESCETSRFAADRSCGCGAKMRRCGVADAYANTYNARTDAFNAEPELIADSVIRNNEPYYNLLTTRRSFVNGTLSEFYRQRQGVGVFNVTAPAPLDAVPAIAYNQQDTWQEYTRSAFHSGVLTTPSFLYRFPTQRARVSEFYEAFLCKTFVPSKDPLPPPEDPSHRDNNLARRAGCNYCHATIEPTGAHWGRFDERNSLFLSPERYPRSDPKCKECALRGDTSCGGECGAYVMQAFDEEGANSLGMLKTYLYRTESEEPNIEGGPSLLVQRMMQTGDMERCTVKRMWHEFLGRPMTAQEQQLYLESLAQNFASNHHSLKSLIETLLMTDAYRRID